MPSDANSASVPEEVEDVNPGATSQSPPPSSNIAPGRSDPAFDQQPQPSSDLGAPDRVFPIRSLVSFDPPSINTAYEDPVHAAAGELSPSRTGARSYSIVDSETWGRVRSQSQSQPSESGLGSGGSSVEPRLTPDESGQSSSQRPSTDFTSIGATPGSSNGSRLPTTPFTLKKDPHDLVTTRFRHVTTDDGHAVITGRTVDSFKACEDEPIHIPGAIQSFGAMVVLREEDDEKFPVRVVSENSQNMLGYSPRDLFDLESFCDVLSEDQSDSFLDHIDFVRDEGYDPVSDGPDVFLLTITCPGGRLLRLWCAMHLSAANKDLVICEFELEEDRENPLRVSGRTSPTIPADTLKVNPTAEQLAGSTVNISQPLRILRNARRRKGEAAAMEVFSIVSQIQDQLARADSMETLLDTTVGIVKELTGFHRVLVYQFDSEWNGKVVAELVDPTMSIDLYKGLHFPAGDIPKQARDLYRINKVRLLYDRDQVTSRLVCRTLEDLETPLDMTHAYLRAMSPIHIKYLANMEIRSSMSISINSSTDLWGLISLHSYGATGMRVSFPVRKMCRLVGDTVSRNIERLSYASRLQARKLINLNTVPTDTNPSGYIVASSDDLLRLFDADYGAICIRGETRILAKSNQSQEILALLEYLKMRRFNSVLSSNHIVKDFKDLRYPPGFKEISGLLYVPLSTDDMDFMVFFRQGQLTEVKWGGNPNLAKFTDGHLEPRKSFQTWRETVLDRSREWTESEVDTAAVLCLVYGKFIRVWRQREAMMENSSLTKLLLANSAHEVRTPLNAIINYLEIALEGPLDGETREHLTKSHSASKSLIYVINDLLDLTNVEKGQDLIKDESFDLRSTFTEATDMFEGEAKRKNLDYTVNLHPGIPETVVGDQRRIRQSMTNLISNAMQHTTTGSVNVQLWHSRDESEQGKTTVKVEVVDTGAGISPATLEALFQELEQVSAEDEGRSAEGGAALDSPPPTQGAQEEKKVLGFGLALVARIVRNMHGQLSVRSEEGKGSRFLMSLQFSIPEDKPDAGLCISRIATPTTESADSFPATMDMVLVDTNKAASWTGSRTSQQSSATHQKSHGDDKSPSPSDADLPDPNPPSISSPVGSATTGAEDKTASPQATTVTTTHPPILHPPSTSTPDEKSDEKSPSSPTVPPEATPLRPTLPTWGDSLLDIHHTSAPPSRSLRVLVAEDDPINSKIIRKRLEKLHHTVRLTGNGEECAIAHSESSMRWDVVLMDIQMPILDGIESTKRIRRIEGVSHPGHPGPRNKGTSRVPIFAVSASLLEKDAQMYMDAGFDGWIMKPINFARLNGLFSGLHDEQARDEATYQPGQWEKGGWFRPYRES